MEGKITNIETMGLVDGPGMRLVLFLAGCNLRCLYCHNPETWTDNENNRKITPEEVLKMFNKYKVYYGETGGVTFSGGEPLIQNEFVLECVKLLKKNGIHVALDTAGGVEDKYDEILDLVDLVILDIKAVKEDEYKYITGQTMDNFNMFLKSLIEKNKKLWLRQVIVPGINDDEAHVLLLKNFASKLKNVERIELLPYHTMGIKKYNELQIKYRLEGVPAMDREKCKNLEKLLKNQ